MAQARSRASGRRKHIRHGSTALLDSRTPCAAGARAMRLARDLAHGQATARLLQDRGDRRLRAHGHRVPRHGFPVRPCRGAEGPPRGREHRSGLSRALPARGIAAGRAPASERDPDLRHGRDRRRAVHRHAARGRQPQGPDPPGHGRARDRAGHPDRGRRGGRRGARGRHRASRHQAGERPDRRRARRPRGLPRRLRPRPRPARADADAARPGHRHARLHGTRAPRGGRRRHSGRHLRLRLPGRRDADRRRPVHARHRRRGHVRARGRPAAERLRAPARAARRRSTT